MSKRYNFQLTTLSPIHIGNGEELSPYSDYIYKNDYVYYIDFNKLEEFFKEQSNFDKLIDEYIKIINLQARTNLKGKQNIENFFERHGLEIESFSKLKVKASSKITQLINQTINSSGFPYVSGSTLKGAIRTGILYKHIHSENLEPKGRSPYIGEDVFGNISDDRLKYLSVSDTNLTERENIRVLKIVRYNLDKKKEDMPVILEVIKDNVSLNFTMDLKGNLEPRFDYLNEGNICKLLSIINEFSLECINREIKELEKNKVNSIYSIINFYHELKKDILKIKDENNGAIFRIGAGKTFFENSIGLALDDNELGKIIASENKKGKIKRNKNFFPKTRAFAIEGDKYNKVLGWVKINLKE